MPWQAVKLSRMQATRMQYCSNTASIGTRARISAWQQAAYSKAGTASHADLNVHGCAAVHAEL